MTYLYEEKPARVITRYATPKLVSQGKVKSDSRKEQIEALIRENCGEKAKTGWFRFAKDILP